MTEILHTIALAIGVTTGSGCLCSICGPSQFDAAKTARQVCGPNFTDYDLIDGRGSDVCAGCAAILGGKPGSDPPPLRTSSFAVVGGVLERIGIDRLVEILSGIVPGVSVVGWAPSRQKHASLRCGRCSPTRYLIGCDYGTIDWRPATDGRLLVAVRQLRRAAMSQQIIDGSYPPHVLSRMPSGWQESEAIVNEYRPSNHLTMAVAIVRRPDPSKENITMPIPRDYRIAAELLAPLCRVSSWRDDDPIRFWADLLPRRLSAASASATVLEWMSYLCDALRVSTSRQIVVDAVMRASDLSPEDAASVLSIIRRDHRLLIAFTRQIWTEESTS